MRKFNRLELTSLSHLQRVMLAYDQCLPVYRLLPLSEAELLGYLVDYLAAPVTTAANPFGDLGRIEQPARYFMRTPFTQEVLHELRKGVSLSLLGESQTGKSSLLYYLSITGAAELSQEVLYLDLQLARTDDDFYEILCEELAMPFTNKPFQLQRKLRGRKVILCLDEIEKMSQFSHDAREGLRGLADGSSAPFQLVIASRTPLSRLFPDNPDHSSPLANICQVMPMPPFTLPEAIAFAQRRAPHMTVNVIHQAYQQSKGHPYQLQQALKRLYGS